MTFVAMKGPKQLIEALDEFADRGIALRRRWLSCSPYMLWYRMARPSGTAAVRCGPAATEVTGKSLKLVDGNQTRAQKCCWVGAQSHAGGLLHHRMVVPLLCAGTLAVGILLVSRSQLQAAVFGGGCFIDEAGLEKHSRGAGQ